MKSTIKLIFKSQLVTVLQIKYCHVHSLKPLFHSSQKTTRKLAASAFKYCELGFAMSGKELIMSL